MVTIVIPRWLVILLIVYATFSTISKYHNFVEGISLIKEDIMQ